MKIHTSNAFKARSISSEHVYTLSVLRHMVVHFNTPEIGMYLKMGCNLDAIKYGSYSIWD